MNGDVCRVKKKRRKWTAGVGLKGCLWSCVHATQGPRRCVNSHEHLWFCDSYPHLDVCGGRILLRQKIPPRKASGRPALGQQIPSIVVLPACSPLDNAIVSGIFRCPHLHKWLLLNMPQKLERQHRLPECFAGASNGLTPSIGNEWGRVLHD